MDDAQIAFSIQKLKDAGILVSGDAVDKGIGCMTDARAKQSSTPRFPLSSSPPTSITRRRTRRSSSARASAWT